MNAIIIITTGICSALAAIGCYILVRNVILKKKGSQIIRDAEIQGENIKKEKIFQAKEKFLQLKSEHEKEVNEKNFQIQQFENKLKQREMQINQQASEVQKKQKEADSIRENLKAQLEVVNKKSEEYEKLRVQAIEKIESIAGMSAAEAKEQLVESMKAEARTQAMSYINDVMDEARLTASKEAKRVVINTIQRIAPETAIENAVTALINQDVEIARKTISLEGEINEKEKYIETLCLKLLLQQQPVASDLRLISSALKMITDMERIGDQAEDIAELTMFLSRKPYIKKLEDIPKMGKAAVKMVNDSINAYVHKDLNLAMSVIAYDDVMDELFDLVKEKLIEVIRINTENGEQAIDLLMVAKYFERIGDHAVNIAEWVVYSITGEHKSYE